MGTADSYDVRFSANPILDDNDFGLAQQVVTGVPTPQPAGSAESMLITGLAPETVTYFAIKAADEAGNVSPLSNVVEAATIGTPPGAVADLGVTGLTGTSVFSVLDGKR